jgi:hypothetical protein
MIHLHCRHAIKIHTTRESVHLMVSLPAHVSYKWVKKVE